MKNNIASIIEAVLFVSGEAVSIETLAEALELTEIEVNEYVEQLAQGYMLRNAGILLDRRENLIQLKTNASYAEYINRVFQPPQKYSLSQSTLEALSIIAYRQPITRSEIESVRGVKSDYVVSALLEKRLIQAVGKKETIGRPTLYGTTDEFLQHFGLASLDELPKLEGLDASGLSLPVTEEGSKSEKKIAEEQ